MSQNSMKFPKKRQRGSVAVVASVSMVGLIGFTGLSVDVGYMQWERTRLQAAADAAAQAALFEVKNNTGNQVQAGQNDASLNGFTTGQNGVTVSINQPPLYGSLAGNSDAVEAVVTQQVSTYFMRIFGMNTMNLTAYAGGLTSTSGSGSGSSGSGSGNTSVAGCVYVLDPTDSQTFFVTGASPTFDCGVNVESTSSTAVVVGSSEYVDFGTNSALSVVGPSSCTISSPAASGCGIDYQSNQSYICVAPATSCSASAAPTGNGNKSPGDPLANISEPTITSTMTKYSNPNYNMNQLPGKVGSTYTIEPGVYCGGLGVGNTNGLTYSFAPGLYVIAGGSFQLQGQSYTTGSGVTFYMTTEAAATAAGITGCGSSTSVAQVNINGQAYTTLTAPGTSPTGSAITGILFFETQENWTTNTAPQIDGNATTVLNGALYFKKSNLLFSGVQSGSTGYMMIVVNQLEINGGSNVTVYNVNNPLKTTNLAGTAGVLAE